MVAWLFEVLVPLVDNKWQVLGKTSAMGSFYS